MNRKMIFYIVGQICKAEALLLLLPAVICLIYRETCVLWFLVTALISGAIGFALTFKKPVEKRIYAREGFTVVALAWVILSVLGALPFFFSGEIPSIVDSVFETVSGFTTTGATIVLSVEDMSKGMLFWRSLTHWLGGMGVLVFVMAVIPLSSNRSMYLMRAEAPGPLVGKLVPKLRDTAKILYAIYLFLTVLEVIFLLLGGMNLFDSAVHAFSTAGTGGFSSKNMSIMVYDSSYIHVVITVFMLLFGINFNLFYFVILRNMRSVLRNEELHWYIGIVVVSVIIIALDIMPLYESAGIAFRDAGFQVSSIITTTGFATADFGKWPELSQVVIIGLMFFGACAGSTGGGLKISRVLLFGKIAKREIRRMVHPQEVSVIRLDGKPVNDESLTGVGSYLTVYIAILAVTVLVLSFDKYDFATNFTAAVSHLNNVGPVLGVIGPLGSVAGYSAFSKILLCFCMLFGRLEIFPLLLTLNPATWRK